jgi:glycosyltransferase involved in cell wall biosynthesis
VQGLRGVIPLPDNKATILHAYKVYLPEVFGGVPEVIRLLAAGLNSPTEIVVSRDHGLGQTSLVEGTPVYRSMTLRYIWSMPVSPLYPLLLWRRIRRAALVSYHFPFPLVDIALTLWMPRRVALVIHWHSEIVEQKSFIRLLGWLFRRMLRRADRIIVSDQVLVGQSPFLREFADKCVVIPFGVEVDAWCNLNSAEQHRIAALRQRHPRLVLAVGRFVPYKGFDVLIEAMSRVDADLVLVGAGGLKDELIAKLNSRGLLDRVTLVSNVDRSTLKCLLHACRVFVLPSITANETFGIAQLEAMAVGKPIVNTQLPTAVPLVARNGQEALTVAPGSPEALADAISRILKDPDLAHRLGANARARAANDFPIQRFLSQVSDTYAAALSTRTRKLSGREAAPTSYQC